MGGRADGEPLYNRVNAISGNRIYLNTPLTQAYLAGDRVVNQSRLIVAGNSSATLENLRIDGNRAGNDEFTNWATTIDVHLSSTGTMIRDVEFVDSPGGALSIHGSNHVITDSRFERINLAVAHFSVATNVTMERNRSFDTNSLAELGEHSTGAYEWSLRNTGITIRDSVVENTDGWAFGHIRVLEGNSQIVIENNVIRNAQGTLELRNSSAAGGNRNVSLRFTGNEVVDSGVFHLSDANQAYPLTGITVEENRFWNGVAKVRSIDTASISGNRWFSAQGGSLPSFLDVSLLGPNVTLEDNAVMTLPLPGDATLDGIVDRRDIAEVIASFGREFGGSWVRGDFNFDGAVTLADLALLQKQLGSQDSASPQATAVPEPQASLSILCALASVFTFRHGRMRPNRP
jgi:hypothetical protein